MLRIYDRMLEVLVLLRDVLPEIGKRDRNLEDQLRRAGTSVVLNIAEGSGSVGKTRALRYTNALGSARECKACLEGARALGYLECVEPALGAKLHEVIGTLVRVIRH